LFSVTLTTCSLLRARDPTFTSIWSDRWVTVPSVLIYMFLDGKNVN
jgi:hypothetical protein